MIRKTTVLLMVFISLTTLACSRVSAHEVIADPCMDIVGDNELQITLYPNPFKSNLQIDLSSKIAMSSVEIRFLNLIGKEMEVKFNMPVNGYNDHLDLDLKQLPAGVYFMEILAKQANGSITKYTRKVTKL